MWSEGLASPVEEVLSKTKPSKEVGALGKITKEKGR